MERSWTPAGCLTGSPQQWIWDLLTDNDKVAQFRRYAEACVRLTEDMQYSSQRALLREMAETWIELAEELAESGPRPKAKAHN